MMWAADLGWKDAWLGGAWASNHSDMTEGKLVS